MPGGQMHTIRVMGGDRRLLLIMPNSGARPGGPRLSLYNPGGRQDFRLSFFFACQAPVGYSPRGLGPGTNPRPEALGVGWTGTQRSPA